MLHCLYISSFYDGKLGRYSVKVRELALTPILPRLPGRYATEPTQRRSNDDKDDDDDDDDDDAVVCIAVRLVMQTQTSKHTAAY